MARACVRRARTLSVALRTLTAMTEETARELEEVRARVAKVGAEAEHRKQDFLAVIARGIPSYAEMLAKDTTHAQSDIAKTLGKEGISQFRTELMAAAAELAADIESASGRMTWPTSSAYSSTTTNGIRSTLFNYMYGTRVNRLADVFKRHGFDIHDANSRRSQSLVLPQSLFSEQEQSADFEAMAEALNELGREERALSNAEAAHDRDVVNSLWED